MLLLLLLIHWDFHHISKFYGRWSPKKRKISREQKVPGCCQGSEVRLNRRVGDLRKATGTHTTAACNRGAQNSLSERTCKHTSNLEQREQAPCVLQDGATQEAAECTLQIRADWRHMAAVNASPDTHMNNKDPSSVLNACDTIGLVGVTCKKNIT